MAEQDSSTRTIAGLGAVLGVFATVIGLGAFLRTTTLAEVAAITKTVMEDNDTKLSASDVATAERIQALEAKLAELEAKMNQPPPAPVAEAEPPKKR